MSSFWGNQLHISIFGESHGKGIGVVVDSPPPGIKLDIDAIRAFMLRRAPGRTPWSTPRKEEDTPEILSGFYHECTTGTPLTAVIRNSDTHSSDYGNLVQVPRPGHGDLTGSIRYKGFNDIRGGGHFSGRLTAPLCFAGAVSLQILEKQGIQIYARIKEIAGIEDVPLDPARPPMQELSQLRLKSFPTLDDSAGSSMIDAVEKARMELDSVGGIVECFITGLPAGIGDPMFGGLEPRLASMLYAIPAVKALSFGSGFDICRRRGSENNDSPFYSDEGGQRHITYKTNHSGGVDGGISNGMPVVFQLGIKPTPSISLEQDSIRLSDKTDAKLVIKGRHDPCIVPRAVPVAEAAAAIVILDSLMGSGWFGGRNA
ncbi:chorismate synthase [Parasporobacterium paucivorans]|uniref:Chorismate synthase n=1 Tax=Parasporobacterium paucivorans DSM 15970 TaxID=1122934 RepID=A0A1M6DPP0_9FIRM|nr:chorismate synthase [Parasporobacterium paucivorans]SHI75142.1 chorismate synthase [Parasporobacterium paucivorans DSM 15970]